jgi:pimeloyl-ACP methyl ester carboxylesterase
MPPIDSAREPWTHRAAIVNGVRLHYVEAGAGPLVILLHGFPEFWYSWRRQVPALAEAGFRAVAPDLRGYNESARPPGVRNYRIELLVDDMAEFIAHLGTDRATVVGHDWGGAIAWILAMRRPERVQRLVILNAPHPAAFVRELATWEQKLRSWYMLFFQLPLLPEWLLRAGDFALVGRMFRRDPVHPEAFTSEDIRRYKKALSRPGALTAALNYYRALFRFGRDKLRDVRPISAPTLLIWGERDRALVIRNTEGVDRWVPGIRVERIADSSHWVQNDAPERVNRLLIEFLRGRG